MKTLWSALALGFLAGCVPTAKYEAALSDAGAKSEEIRRLTAVNTELEAERQGLVERLKKSREELEAGQAQLDAQRKELASITAEKGNMAQSIEKMEQALRELEERRARSEAALKEFRDLVARFQSMIDAGTLKVKVIDGRMIVELATDILFAPGSAGLSKEGKAAIAEVAAVLASIPDRQYQVAGHTDNQPIATAQFPSNWYLGSARAIEVVRVLVEGGLAPERVSAASHAEFQPADSNKTTEGRSNNRRIEIIVIPDLTAMPGFDELQKLEDKVKAP